MIAVALHIAVILAAAAVIARELARELVYLRVAYAGPRVTRPWRGPVIARPSGLRARAADTGPTPPAQGEPPPPAVRWPHHVVVEISTGVRVYRLRAGDPWQTREEVEVHGRLVGWSDTLGGTCLPQGMRTVDLAGLPRARRAPPEPPIAVDVSSWCALPVTARDSVRLHTSAEKAPGVMRLGVVSVNTRSFVERILQEHGLTIIERSAEQIVWGTL